MKLKKGDNVQVLRGKDKGKTGKITDVLSKTNQVIVEGVNQYKRHLKARSQQQKSEIVTITKPYLSGAVAFVCQKCKKATRIGYKITGKEKVRVCRKCEAVI